MSSRNVVVVDYGLGNLYSVKRALEVSGAEDVCISSDPRTVINAERLVLPGVGAFATGMEGLASRGLTDAIADFAVKGRPLLGICLGMQMLATEGEEFGISLGLNLIPGRVVPIPIEKMDGTCRKVPHIGWAALQKQRNSSCGAFIMENIPENSAVYLVHSYQFQVQQDEDILACYDFEGCSVAAAIAKDNVLGLQFHPEKSGEVGLKMLSNFIFDSH